MDATMLRTIVEKNEQRCPLLPLLSHCTNPGVALPQPYWLWGRINVFFFRVSWNWISFCYIPRHLGYCVGAFKDHPWVWSFVRSLHTYNSLQWKDMKKNQRREMVQGEKPRGNQEQVSKSPSPVESHGMRLNRSAMMYDNICNVLSTWEAPESVFLLGVSHVSTQWSNDWPQ